MSNWMASYVGSVRRVHLVQTRSLLNKASQNRFIVADTRRIALVEDIR